MQNKPIRLYLDTSVIGGCFDPEFMEDSRRIFSAVRKRLAVVLYSETIEAELINAPQIIRDFFSSLSSSQKRLVQLTEEMEYLAAAYVAAGIVSAKWMDDCRHVAAATVVRADAIVSWNFKHIVRFDRIRLYNQVNLANGFGLISIVSPKEVIFDENI